MSKTYRALAIVAIVTPLVCIGWLLLSWYILNRFLPSAPTGGDQQLPAILLPAVWAPAVSSFAAPVIATFSVVVAAQSRRWAWVVVFILLGLFGAIGLTPSISFQPFMSYVEPLSGVIGPLITGYGPMVLLAVVALIFALLPRGGTQTSANTGAA